MACICLNSIHVPRKKKDETTYDLNIIEEKTRIVELEEPNSPDPTRIKQSSQRGRRERLQRPLGECSSWL
jgi:hypothetical protein